MTRTTCGLITFSTRFRSTNVTSVLGRVHLIHLDPKHEKLIPPALFEGFGPRNGYLICLPKIENHQYTIFSRSSMFVDRVQRWYRVVTRRDSRYRAPMRAQCDNWKDLQ